MAITLIDVEGFESGGIEGLTATDSIEVVTTPAPWTSKETYVCNISNLGTSGGAWIKSVQATPGTDWNSMAFYMQWDNFQRSGDTFRFFGANEIDPHFSLHMVTESADLAGLRLNDANDSQIGSTKTGLFITDQMILVEMKWKKSNTGDIQIKVNGDLVFDETGEDLDSGVSNVEMYMTNLSSQTFAINSYIGSYYYQTDDGANMNTNKTLYGKYTILGAWKTGQTGAIPDSGDTLDSGIWANTEEVPQDNSVIASYSTAAGVDESGLISKDKATTGGPKNDSEVDNSIHGGKWIWVWKAPLRTFFGPVPRWWGKYGASAFPTSDNTSNTALQKGNNAWKNYFVVSNTISGVGRVPQTGDHAQIGFGAEGTENSGTVSVADMWCFILHEEQRVINMDGQIIRVKN